MAKTISSIDFNAGGNVLRPLTAAGRKQTLGPWRQSPTSLIPRSSLSLYVVSGAEGTAALIPCAFALCGLTTNW